VATVKDYYSDNALSVQFYDLITSVDPHIKGDVEFYCNLLRSPPRGALELGCGTGRVALALAARGYKVVGLDSSEPMLARARAKCRSLPELLHRNASFINGDMTAFDIALRFDLIAVPYYSFNHLRGRVPRARCLETIATHLARGSHAVIHASSPEMFLERRGTREMTFRFNDPTYDRLEVTWHEAAVDETDHSFKQIIEYRLFGKTGAVISASAERLKLWWFEDNELLFSAQKAGLELERTLTSFGPEQGRSRIYVLRKGAERAEP
jgi:SAM-dependent methyltransferase